MKRSESERLCGNVKGIDESKEVILILKRILGKKSAYVAKIKAKLARSLSFEEDSNCAG